MSIQSVQSWKSYGIVVLSVVVSSLARAILASLLGSNVPYITFFPAVIFSALYGGYRAGLLAMTLSAIAVLAWVDPLTSFKFDSLADRVSFILFLCVSSLIVWLCERARRASYEASAINQKNTTILESISDLFFGLDFDWRFTYVNSPAEKFLGRKREELIGRNLWEVFPAAKGSIFDEFYHKAMKERTSLSFESTSTVNQKWLEVNVYPSDEGLAVYGRDITRRKKAEKEREELLQREQQAREAAEKANILKDEFLATVSHELRTPLNAILGWATIAKNGDFPPVELKRTLEIIERNAKSQNKIIEDILDVSRIITGKFNLNMNTVNLISIIENALDSMRPAAEAKQIKIITRIKQVASVVQADFDRLQQVVWNLLSNAVKFTPEGGRIEVGLNQRGKNFEISVHDSGIGIEPEFLPFAFDRFRQAEGGTSRKYGGLGLGLAIVRHITELHGGSVSVESEGIGKGATFTISLPVDSSAQALNKPFSISQTIVELDSSNSPTGKLSGTRFLVVDDESEARELVSLILKMQGANVMTAESVTDALAKMKDNFPDVLISDIGTPINDGLDLIKQVKTLYPQAEKLKTIALTAYARKEDEEKTLSEGYQYHLTKPLEASKLNNLLTEIVK